MEHPCWGCWGSVTELARTHVGVLVPGESAVDRLSEHGCHGVPDVGTAAPVDQVGTVEIEEAEDIIKLTIGEQTGIAGDVAAVEFELQGAVEIRSERAVFRFTRHFIPYLRPRER